MKILGYSERGIINALFYEIRYSKQPETLLGELISKIKFPFLDDFSLSVVNSEIFIEQSFSDFGDSDVLILIDTGKAKFQCSLRLK